MKKLKIIFYIILTIILLAIVILMIVKFGTGNNKISSVSEEEVKKILDAQYSKTENNDIEKIKSYLIDTITYNEDSIEIEVYEYYYKIQNNNENKTLEIYASLEDEKNIISYAIANNDENLNVEKITAESFVKSNKTMFPKVEYEIKQNKITGNLFIEPK